MQITHKPQAVARYWKTRLGGLLLPVLLVSGCASSPHTAEGAAGGAVVGGIFGTILGLACHRPLEGAAIGAAAGGGLGAANGAAADARDKRYAQASAQAAAADAQRSQQELSTIADMTQKGINEAVIINHVRGCGVVFNLSGEQLEWLKQAGVSDRVVVEMQATAAYRPQQVIYSGQPVYVAEPAPVGVGVGVGVHIR